MSELRRILATNRLFLGVVLAAVVARLLVAWLLPPLVDIYYYDAQGARALLSGIDPYGFSYTGIPSWLLTPGASNVFPYLPGVVLFLAPFAALWDVRLGLIFADVLVTFSIFYLGGSRARNAALAFMLLPLTAVFSTSYPNNTLVAIAFLGIAISLWARKKGRVASAMMGVALASSQFIWFLFPLFLSFSMRAKKFGEIAIQVAVGLAITIPFALWNWSAFAYDTLAFEFARAPRIFLSAAQFGYNVNPVLDGVVYTLTGLTVPLWLRAALVVVGLFVAAAKSCDLPSVLRNSTILMTFVIFVLPNDLSWWYLELPFVTLLMWYVVSRGASPMGATNP